MWETNIRKLFRVDKRDTRGKNNNAELCMIKFPLRSMNHDSSLYMNHDSSLHMNHDSSLYMNHDSSLILCGGKDHR